MKNVPSAPSLVDALVGDSSVLCGKGSPGEADWLNSSWFDWHLGLHPYISKLVYIYIYIYIYALTSWGPSENVLQTLCVSWVSPAWKSWLCLWLILWHICKLLAIQWEHLLVEILMLYLPTLTLWTVSTLKWRVWPKVCLAVGWSEPEDHLSTDWRPKLSCQCNIFFLMHQCNITRVFVCHKLDRLTLFTKHPFVKIKWRMWHGPWVYNNKYMLRWNSMDFVKWAVIEAEMKPRSQKPRKCLIN